MSWNLEDDETPVHPQKFSELPKKTQEWLSNLRPSDIRDIEESMEFIQKIKVISGFAKWAWLVAVGSFLGGIALWESILKVVGWVKK